MIKIVLKSAKNVLFYVHTYHLFDYIRVHLSYFVERFVHSVVCLEAI